MHAKQVLGPSLSRRLEQLESSLLEYYDALGILIIIRVVTINKEHLQRQHILVLDSYFSQQLALLWFEAIYSYARNLILIKNVDN